MGIGIIFFRERMRRKGVMEMSFNTRKRPCRVCGKWYMPAPRSRGYQKTCGRPECRREWHRKKCAQWNANHRLHFKAIYLGKKLSKCGNEKPPLVSKLAPPSRGSIELPRREVQEVTGAKLLVIIEYLAQLLIRRFQEGKRAQPFVNKGKTDQLPPEAFSRSDG
jgi:hypothetical protein